ncbi:MAG: hypothetical protein PHT60_10335 [Acidiphilium sp.]|nr:hypothetical protein [Acidiphilium sp.]
MMKSLGRMIAGFGIATTAVGGAGAMMLPPLGLWQGEYTCAQGKTGLALQITALSPTTVRAVFYFHALASNPGVPQGCFAMRGHFDAATRHLTLSPTRWLAQPPFYVWTGLSGTVERDGSGLTGTIEGPACTDFALTPSAALPVPPAPASCRMDQNGPTV